MTDRGRMIEAPGERLRVLRRLGEGGMAEVVLVERTRPGLFRKQFALKRLAIDAADQGRLRALIRKEAALGGRLAHPNICQVHDAWEDEGGYYLLLDYLEGLTLERLARRAVTEPGLADVRLLSGILVQICEGLHHAHELHDERGRHLGVVHRDVTPSNLFVTRAGVAKVLDFGVARSRAGNGETTPGRKGKWAYMAPEYIEHQRIDRRADVFSAATVLYELLAGSRAFRRRTAYLSALAVLTEPLAPLSSVRFDVPVALADAIACGMARDPDRRFATARSFRDAIADAVTPLGGPASLAEIARTMATATGEDWMASAPTAVLSRPRRPRCARSPSPPRPDTPTVSCHTPTFVDQPAGRPT